MEPMKVLVMIKWWLLKDDIPILIYLAIRDRKVVSLVLLTMPLRNSIEWYCFGKGKSSLAHLHMNTYGFDINDLSKGLSKFKKHCVMDGYYSTLNFTNGLHYLYFLKLSAKHRLLPHFFIASDSTSSILLSCVLDHFASYAEWNTWKNWCNVIIRWWFTAIHILKWQNKIIHIYSFNQP